MGVMKSLLCMRMERLVRNIHQLVQAGLVNMNGEGLGEKIGKIIFTRCPFDSKLLLPNAVADPVETHIDALGPLDLTSVVGQFNSELIVGGDFR